MASWFSSVTATVPPTMPPTVPPKTETATNPDRRPWEILDQIPIAKIVVGFLVVVMALVIPGDASIVLLKRMNAILVEFVLMSCIMVLLLTLPIVAYILRKL